MKFSLTDTGRRHILKARALAAILALAVLAGEPAQGAPEDKHDFFAPALQTDGYSCGDSPVVFPALSSFEAGWFSRHLRAADEPSLYQASLAGKGVGKSYRFTWLRSFHAPIIVRIDETPTGGMRMTAKRLSGKGGYAPGHVEASISRRLTIEEATALRHLLASSTLTNEKPAGCDEGLDGAQWIVETNIDGDYRFVNRWGGSAPSVREFGLMLLGFTGWETTPLY